MAAKPDCNSVRTRIVLKPSNYNPRGVRPYVLQGEYHGDPVPGVIVRGDRFLASADAVQPLLAEGLEIVSSPRATHVLEPPPLPDIVRDYQKNGIRFLASSDFAVLGDEMGIGKTMQALGAAELRLSQAVNNDPNDFAVLIICPALAKQHWKREIKRWTGHDSIILDGLRPDSSFGLCGRAEEGHAIRRARYVIINYDVLFGQRRRNAAGKFEDREGLEGWGKLLSEVRFPIVILDEVHRARGRTSRRTKAIKDLVKHAICVWGLSGTITGGKIKDLWSIWDLVSKGLAGGFWDWARAYCEAHKGQYGWIADGRTESRMTELSGRLVYWFLARTKAKVGQQLPPKTVEIVPVDVGEVKYDRAAYDPSDKNSKYNVIGEALRKTAAAKLPVVTEMALEALENKQNVVVGVFLKAQAEEIARRIVDAQHDVLLVNGEMSPVGRDLAAKAFCQATRPTAFVATIDSVVEAIDLTGADLQIIGDLTWDPTKLAQFIGRCHRVTSTKPILVRLVIAAGTLDEKIVESVIGKLDTLSELGLGTVDDKDLHARLGGEAKASTEAVLDELFKELTEGAEQ